VCFWEDDPVQNEDPQYRGGANSLSLEQARNNYVEMGTSQREFVNNVRPPTPEEMPILRLLVGLDKERQAAVHRQAKIRILAMVRGMLSGGINIIDGCDRIATLALQVDSHWDDKLRLFGDVASECDEFPRGSARQEWEPHALARMDLELARRADRIRDRVLSACHEFEMLLKADLRGSASPHP
jgi:hypothetical protein